MTIYLSIPITGKCELSQRKKAKMFQRYFEALGNEVVNPFDIYDQLRKCHLMIPGKEPTYEEILREDLCNLEWCSHIFLCDGWTESKGCITEVEKALEYNIKVLFESNYKFE